MKRRSIILAVTLRTAPWALLLAGLLPARGQPFDLILRGGRVIDGTGNPAARVDVGIRDGKIAALGGLTAAKAPHVFDVTGKIVCPDFIDLHSHAEGGLGSSDPRRRAAPNLVSQGITSVCVNPDGGGPWPIGAQRRNFEERRVGPNALLMVGHDTVRRLAMQTDFKRAATPAEVTRMRELVRLGLQEGAWGMSGGLEYVPGIWSTTEELVELVREIAAVGGAYIVHQRSESTDPRWYRPSVDPAGMPTLLDAVRETIHIGETTGATVVWSHAKVMGAHYWGASTAAIRLIAEARARGVDVWADQYPYNSTGGDGAVVLVPAWALGDDPFSSARGRAAGPKREFSYAENLRKAMADPAQAEKIRRDLHHEIARRGGPENIVVFDYPDRSYLGRNLAELAKQEKIGPFEMALELQYRGFRDRPGGSRLRVFWSGRTMSTPSCASPGRRLRPTPAWCCPRMGPMCMRVTTVPIRENSGTTRWIAAWSRLRRRFAPQPRCRPRSWACAIGVSCAKAWRRISWSSIRQRCAIERRLPSPTNWPPASSWSWSTGRRWWKTAGQRARCRAGCCCRPADPNGGGLSRMPPGQTRPSTPRPGRRHCAAGRGLLRLATILAVCGGEVAGGAERARPQRPDTYHRFEPLAPAASLEKVRLPPGYRADIVAAEPMVQEPVWIAWDGNGAMYVAEMNSYMQDVHGTGTKTRRNGRIKRLFDDDGDGVMDRATVFVDHLLLPRMILALDERILVQETDSSSIVAYRDTDGDGVADERTVLLEGEPSSLSVEHQDSGLTWNLDNWMYTAQGGRRFRFTRGRWESERVLEQMTNQWGLGMDDTGVMYYSTNHVPGRNFNQHWYYWNLIGERWNWPRFNRPEIGPEAAPGFQLTYRVQPIGDRADQARTSWTSASGLSIYRGDALPAEAQGNLFLAEPCAHAVRRAVVERDEDGKRTLRNAQEKAEFFMSADFYCRPVSTHTGPDGGLYIVDMYRGIVQDAPWVPPEFARRIQGMGADQVKNRGRIYRILSTRSESRPGPMLLDARPAALVEHLSHANGWWRDMAQRLLILRGDRAVIPLLEAMARSHANPLARLHAGWSLEGLDALTPALRDEKLRDDDPRLRAAAIRWHEPELRRAGGEAVVARLAGCAKDAEPEVRRQLVLTLGWSETVPAREMIQDIAAADPGNSILSLATLTALYRQWNLPLIARIQEGRLFAGIRDEAKRDRARTIWSGGLEAWKRDESDLAKPRVRDPALVALIDRGARHYDQQCAACHGPDGRGVTPPGAAALAPPLDGSARVNGPKEALTRILLHGLTGPIDGRIYETGQMAPLGSAMPDDGVAAVLSYIRQAWGNDAPGIQPAEVAAIRRTAGPRATPWTLMDLATFSGPLLTNRREWKATASGYRAENAIDGVVDGRAGHAWFGANNPGSWLAVDLGRRHQLTHLLLHAPDPYWAPRGYKVEVSDDGVTWSEPVSVSKTVPPGQRTLASFEPTVARWIRIVQTGNAIERWVVSELELFGTPEAATGFP